MSELLDYTGRHDPAILKAGGYKDVSRYLTWEHYWDGVNHTDYNPKLILPGEYDALLGGGVSVTLNWEFDTYDWLGGASAAYAHASEACRLARIRNYPSGAVIIGSCDFNVSMSDWNFGGVKDYATIWDKEIRAGGYRPGGYGPWDFIQWCVNAGLLDMYWQAGMSTAWSGGRNAVRHPAAHARQIRQENFDGENVDVSEIIAFWPRGGALNMALEYGPVGKPNNGYGAWTYQGVSRADMQGAVLLDIAAQEFDSVSDYDGTSKSKRTLLLEEVQQGVRDIKKALQGASVSLTDAQLTNLEQSVTAAVIASHDALKASDEPIIADAVRTGVRDILHSV